MDIYRLSPAKYARDLSGTGAMKKGGRWNRKGTPVVYTSDSAALAILEYLANIDHDLAPANLALVIIEVPDDIVIEHLSVKDLPVNWNTYPAPDKLAELGSAWADNKDSLLLHVPSVHVPVNEGHNYVLNPVHPDFSKITIKEIPYSFDKRLT